MWMFLIAIICITGAIIMIDRRSFLGGILFGILTIIVFSIGLINILSIISDSSDLGNIFVLVFAYLFVPLTLIVVCGWLIYNSRIMATKEGKSVTAKLSMVLGLNLIIVIALMFIIVTDTFLIRPFWFSSILVLICLINIVFTFIFIAYLLYSLFYQMIPVKKKIDYIIILGAGIKSDKVTPLLKSRLDKAIAYQKEQATPFKFVVSGGQGPDEPVSEAYAMRKYLLSQGIDDELIIFEDQSATTLENMLFSKKLIEKDWNNVHQPNILFSTSNYHVFRGALYAKKAKIKANGIGAPVALYFLPTALIREFIALLVSYKWFTITIILLLTAFVLYTTLPLYFFSS